MTRRTVGVSLVTGEPVEFYEDVDEPRTTSASGSVAIPPGRLATLRRVVYPGRSASATLTTAGPAA